MTYIYPENLRAQAQLWLWTLRDIVIIGIGLIVGVLIFTQLRFPLPLVVACTYSFLSIQLDDVSIKLYILWAWRYFISKQQYYEWGIECETVS
jgi:hypothetical protein